MPGREAIKKYYLIDREILFSLTPLPFRQLVSIKIMNIFKVIFIFEVVFI